MAKFSTAANDNQIKYGSKQMAATLDSRQNRLIVAQSVNQSIPITTRPPPIDCRPKNTADQDTFKANCAENSSNAGLSGKPSCRFCQIKYSDTAIKKYSTVQTGPNTSFGGENQGFCTVTYQPVTAGRVNALPIAAAPKQTIRLTRIFFNAKSCNRHPPLCSGNYSPHYQVYCNPRRQIKQIGLATKFDILYARNYNNVEVIRQGTYGIPSKRCRFSSR